MENYNEILEKFLAIKSFRPILAKREFDQFYATPETSISKALIMKEKGQLDGKNILILGDDDLVSVTCYLVGTPKSVTVVEIDKDLVESITSIAKKSNFPIKVIQEDLRKPHTHLGQYDTIAFDPPYTPSGAATFLKIAIAHSVISNMGNIFMCFGAGPKNDSKILNLQNILSSLNLIITEKRLDFNKYEGASGVLNTSSLYIIKTTANTDVTDIDFEQENFFYTNTTPPIIKMPIIEHFSGVFYDVPVDTLVTARKLEKAVFTALEKLEIKWIAKSLTKFKGGGITLNLALKQSNCSVHTWPELKMAHVDLLVCERIKQKNLIGEAFAKNLEAKSYAFRRLE